MNRKKLKGTKISICEDQCRSSPTLSPQMLTGAPLIVICKKRFDVMLHFETVGQAACQLSCRYTQCTLAPPCIC